MRLKRVIFAEIRINKFHVPAFKWSLLPMNGPLASVDE
jgi:hypothetical protein